MNNLVGGVLNFSDAVKIESLNQRLLRQKSITANIANAETPGYRAIGYEFEKQLGRGSFGKVYQALHKPTNELVAVKVRISSAICSMINNVCAPVLL